MNLEVDIEVQRASFRLSASAHFQARKSAIVGESGAGKTTLLDALAGLLEPARGVIRFDGETLFSSDQGISIRPEHRRFAYVLQDNLLFPHLTVHKNLMYGRPKAPSPSISMEHVVHHLQLHALLERRPATLSGGEQRRVALGRALLSSPRLLLLDEPFTGLDANLKDQIRTMIETISSELKIPLLLVSHDREIVDRIDAETRTLSQGTLLTQGPLAV